jgi:hypothetical protein
MTLAMIAPGFEALRRARRLSVGLLLVSLAGAAACDKVPLTAPTGSTVTLFTNTTILPVNGTAEITATVIESGGTFVQNGTVVTFSTNLGSLDPAEARTRNGQATVRLLAGTRSGVATVRAFSGSASTSGGESSTNIEINIGGAAAGRVALSANPSNVSAAGGSSTLTAVVFDTSGNRLNGVPVSFTSTAGSLGSSVVVTDGNGEARTTLTTTRTATVTARVGGGGEGAVEATAEITAIALPTVSVTASPAAPFAGQPVTFSITATAAEGAIRSLSVDFGDGVVESYGQTTSVQHVYQSANTYTIRVTAEDTNGGRNTGSTTIVVSPAVPILASLTATPNSTTTGVVVSFAVTITQNPNNIPVSDVTFFFGDGNSRSVSSLTTTHLYGATGNMLARAVVRFVNGQTSEGQTSVAVR